MKIALWASLVAITTLTIITITLAIPTPSSTSIDENTVNITEILHQYIENDQKVHDTMIAINNLRSRYPSFYITRCSPVETRFERILMNSTWTADMTLNFEKDESLAHE
ncbi:hypothetical protein BGW38_003903, partial [Lunasporangiospora selenospora]